MIKFLTCLFIFIMACNSVVRCEDSSEEDSGQEQADPPSSSEEPEASAATDEPNDGDELDSADVKLEPKQAASNARSPAEPANSFPVLSAPVDFAALKADQELMASLSDYLNRYGIRLPQQLINQVDETDLCPDHASDGLKYYCLKMADGQYHDPWNPWCGYIECAEGVAVRHCCGAGTWMGMGEQRPTDGLSLTKADMCRRLLSKPIENLTCYEGTDHNLCGKAKAIEGISQLASLSRKLSGDVFQTAQLTTTTTTRRTTTSS